MKFVLSTEYSHDATEISHNRRYPIRHLEEVLFPLFEKNYTFESLRETINSANHIWCAYEYGKCLGCVLMTDIGSNGGLYMILFGVRQSAQGRGIGKRLLENTIKWSRNHGYRFIYLHTEHENRKALRMYEKAGFRQELHQPDYMKQMPQLGSDAIPLVLFLI